MFENSKNDRINNVIATAVEEIKKSTLTELTEEQLVFVSGGVAKSSVKSQMQ
jgi:hypothetical protein